MRGVLDPLDLNISGGIGCGLIMASAVFGINTVQTFLYYCNFPADKRIIKCGVGALWLFALFQLAVLTHAVYERIVLNWLDADASGLVEITWEVVLFQSNLTVSSVTTQSFLAYRLGQLTKIRIVPIIMGTAIAAHLALGIVVQTRALQAPNFQSIVAHDKLFITSWIGVATLVDTILAFGMSYILSSKKTGLRSTDRVIKSMAFFANTGLIPSFCALTAIIIFAAKGFNFMVLFIIVPSSGIYNITLLGNLHVRKDFRRRLLEGNENGFHLTQFERAPRPVFHVVSVRKPLHPAPSSNAFESGEYPGTLVHSVPSLRTNRSGDCSDSYSTGCTAAHTDYPPKKGDIVMSGFDLDR